MHYMSVKQRYFNLLKDGKKTIEFDFIDEDEASDEEKYILGIIDSILGAELPFSEDGDTITIGFLSFKKK